MITITEYLIDISIGLKMLVDAILGDNQLSGKLYIKLKLHITPT